MAISNKYYVYQHVIKGTDRVFYIGKGSGNRAWSKSNRNANWHNIALNGYDVYIIKDFISDYSANELEKYYIKAYGRADLNEGCLVNQTDGGKENKRNFNKKGYKVPKSNLSAMSDSRFNIGKLVLDLSTGIYYNTIREASNILNKPERTVYRWLSGYSKNKSNLILV